MKKYSFYYLFFLLAGSVVAFSCGKDDDGDPPPHISVTSITISPAGPLTLEVGTEQTLRASIAPENATDKTVIWSSNALSVATVSEEGLVRAVSEGSATITAAAADGREATCQITVAAAVVPVESITLTPSEDFSLNVNETKQLAVVVTPETATDKTVVWESASPGVATVANGLVTAVSAGTARITATAGGRSASLNVTVTDPLTQGWVSSSGQWGYPATAFAIILPSETPHIQLSFSGDQCSEATMLFAYNGVLLAQNVTGPINSCFPDAATITTSITGMQRTILKVDLLKVGVERLFEGKTIGEIQQWAQGNMEEILGNWWAALQLCNTLSTNNDWEIAQFSYFNSPANGHIDYLLLDMDTMGITETEVEDQQMVPTACQLELFFNNVTGKYEEAYVYMQFAAPAGGLDFAANYIKSGIHYNDDVAGTQARGENLEIPLHEISNNFFSGKTRAEMIETAKDEIIRNVLNLCIK